MAELLLQEGKSSLSWEASKQWSSDFLGDRLQKSRLKHCIGVQLGSTRSGNHSNHYSLQAAELRGKGLSSHGDIWGALESLPCRWTPFPQASGHYHQPGPEVNFAEVPAQPWA